ncbi:7-deoxyloganetic acid glucosyltransferase [Bertholletia excelsa]
MDQETQLPPHVLFFPLHLQSPLNSMLKLAELLCLAGGLHVTFLNSLYNHRRLLLYSDITTRIQRYSCLQFATISDGLPEDHPRCGERVIEMFATLQATTKPLFREMITSGCLISPSRRPFTCIIAETVLSFAMDVADEMGIPVIYFDTISPSCLWIYACIPKLIEAGERPLPENDLDAPITCVPSMEGFLRRRDLPGFCRAGDFADPNARCIMIETQKLPNARGLITNTFEELDGPILSHLRSICPNLYAVGPVHTHLKAKLAAETSPPPPTSSNSLWREDRSCMAWLDAQPPESVVYVSVGSVSTMTVEELMEIWHGLVNSGKRFLWVRRENSIVGDDWVDQTSTKLLEATKERGCVVSWAPQEEVLGHGAVGGFLTHGGWNSTLESMVEGVPMVCWPRFVDQQASSRFVEKV